MRDLGGYQILDLKGFDFAIGTKQVFENVWDTLESTCVPIMVCNLVVAGTELRNTWIVDLKFDSTNYVGTIYDYTITIGDDNGITITNKA